MRYEEDSSLVFAKGEFKGFTGVVIEVVRRLIEDEKVVLSLCEKCKKQSRSLTSGEISYFSHSIMIVESI